LSLRERLENGFESWGRLVIRHRWLVIALAFGSALIPGTQIPGVEIDTSTDQYLHEDDPTRVAYEAFRNQFGRDEIAMIAIRAPEIFDVAFLQKLRSFHDDLDEEVPLLEEITSLVNARSTRGEGDELIVEDLAEQWSEKPEEMSALRERVLANPLYRNLLISEDGRTTVVMLESQNFSSAGSEEDALGGFDELEEIGAPRQRRYLTGAENATFVEAILQVISRHQTPDFQLHLAGSPAMVHLMQQKMHRDLARFMALAVGSVSLLLFALFRRVAGVVLPLVVVGLSLCAIIGVMGFRGDVITPATQILPSFLFAVGVGYSVHILAIFFQRLHQGAGREDAITSALGHSGLAVIMTALTTVGGLICFTAAELAPVVDFGLFASLGVMVALFYTLLMLPALLAVFPMLEVPSVRRRRAQTLLNRAMLTVGDFSARNPWKVMAATAAVALLSLTGALELRFSHDPITWFPEDDPLRQATELINRELRGLVNFELLVDTGEENGLHDPALLGRIEEMQLYAESYRDGELYVGKSVSLLEILKEIHQALNENRREYYAIPGDRDLIAQELLLFESSGSDDLENFVDSQFSVGRYTMKLPWSDASRIEPFVNHLEERFREMLDGRAELVVTGFAVMMTRTLNALTRSMAKSYAIALAIITPLMILLIGNIRGGLVSMVPNLSPILLTMGMMGWFGIPLDAFTVLIGCIAIGLAVDDTIHFIHSFRRYFEQSGDAFYAVQRTIETTGQALLFTTLVLSTGFFIFMFSSLANLVNFGLLTGFTIAAALVANIAIAPALLVLITRSERVSVRGVISARRGWSG
jgi:hydrophobe/amphiphile efflux-3 (HAE3) family protein